MVSMEFVPTTEQVAIIAAAQTDENIVVTAVAGSGKTSTLRLIAEAKPKDQILYLAFNKAIKDDAADSFPRNVTAKTAHAVALAWAAREHSALITRMSSDRQPKPWDAAKTLRTPNGYTIGERSLTGNGIAALAQATVGRFCHSADETLSERHVPREFDDNGDQAEFRTFIMPFARKAWADLTSPNGGLILTHKKNGPDVYLKLWSMACPVLRYKVILFDEAQDADPAIAHVIENQSTAQIIMVGDASQAIYGWRGAVDALSRFNAPHRLTLTQSFRFGPAIAEAANRFLALLDAPVRVVGHEAKDSTVEPLIDADAILCRTNAGVIEYAMDAQARGRKVAIVGSTVEIERFTNAAQKLMNIEAGARGMVTHPDLAGFNTWSDVVKHAASDDGTDIRVMVRLIETYGTEAILAVCAASVNEADADVIVSTAHKAKGREWDSVRIGADFARKAQDEPVAPSATDLMLAYVAVTRAKLALDMAALEGMLAVI